MTIDRRKLFFGGVGAFAASALGGAQSLHSAAAARSLATLTRAGVAFQTPVAITLAGPDEAGLEHAMTAAFAGVRDVERAASVYRRDSELSRLNRAGQIEAPSKHLTKLVRFALDLATETGGAFDPTVQPLWDVWADAAAHGLRPTSDALRRTVERIDWRGVMLDANGLSFDRSGMAMTLNSINQGYAADVVMDILTAHGIADAFVDTGEFGARGRHPEGRDWRLGVAAPRAPETLAFTLDPFRRFAATSGDYKTAFSPDFADHHIFDPKTGRSPPGWSSITVTAPSGLMADGLSTALFTSDAEGCRKLLRRHPDCAARFFQKDGKEATIVA